MLLQATSNSDAANLFIIIGEKKNVIFSVHHIKVPSAYFVALLPPYNYNYQKKKNEKKMISVVT